MPDFVKRYGTVLFPIDTNQPTPSLLIKNGRVLDPSNNIDKQLSVAVKDGVIMYIGEGVPDGFTPDKTIDASGQRVVPGLMDMHVHLREPGREDKETIATGTCAAAAGGFTAVACMPNTTPVLDEESKIRYVVQRGENCPCRIYPIGAITKNQQGEELAPFEEMIVAGARGFSDDGRSVANARMMRNAFNYSKSFNIPLISHCEEPTLSKNGVMNESVMSTRLGLRGISSISEEIIVSRDTMIAEYTQTKIHIAHVSTAGSVRIIRHAKERGVKVTAETAPHYFILSDEDLITYDTNKKMNPPLRTPRDREAIIEGLKDGTLDVIATDHAPHTIEDKDVEFSAAAFGVIGLETSIGASITYLINKKLISPLELIAKMSVNPNKILSTNGGTLGKGAPADITLIDPHVEWKVQPEYFFSKGINSAFKDMTLKGCATMTILDGRIVFERNS